MSFFLDALICEYEEEETLKMILFKFFKIVRDYDTGKNSIKKLLKVRPKSGISNDRVMKLWVLIKKFFYPEDGKVLEELNDFFDNQKTQ